MEELENSRANKEVVILLTDMVQYSRLTQEMRPEEIRDFITEYYNELGQICSEDEYQPLTLVPSAGDGCVIILDKRDGHDAAELCQRALAVALACNRAIDEKRIPATRMGLFLGEIIEAKIGDTMHRFGSSFAVASRLEELCGYYGTPILMDREMARNQAEDFKYIVAVGKITPKNFTNPYNLFTVIVPGIGKYKKEMDGALLERFVFFKNEAMEFFSGNLLTGSKPDFPKARDLLSQAQRCHLQLTGRRDAACDRIIEYIREFPFPQADFKYTGIRLGAKKGDALGLRLFHLSKQLLRVIDSELYNALVVHTDWENYFQLEWCEQGDIIVAKGDPADGIYYIDSGFAHAEDEEGNIIAHFTDGNIFGEMAYYNKEKVRNATVIADSDVVLRKVTNADFEKLPMIKRLFKRLAERREGRELLF